MSEQQATSVCPHPEAVGTRWGDPISAERQADLLGYLDRRVAETDHGECMGQLYCARYGHRHRRVLHLGGVSCLSATC
jgi:hypothetical protein